MIRAYSDRLNVIKNVIIGIIIIIFSTVCVQAKLIENISNKASDQLELKLSDKTNAIKENETIENPDLVKNSVSDLVKIFSSPSTFIAHPNETFTMDVKISPVNDLMTFTTEILFDPEVITIVGLTEGKFLNENGFVQTTFLNSITTNGSTGKCMIAISRLTTPASGISSSETNTLLSIEIKAKNKGSTSLLFKNTGLIGPDGMTTYNLTTNPGNIQILVEENYSTVSFSSDGINIFPGETFVSSVQVENVQNLYAVSFDLNYDPKNIEITSITEGDFLNESGQTNTIFLKDIDNEIGKAVVGISRLNTTSGVSTGNPQNLFQIKFNSKAAGYSDVYLSNVGLIAPNGKTTYPVYAEKLSINVKLKEGIITGIITNKSNGLPVEGAIVRALDYESEPSDAKGKYLLEVPFGYGYDLIIMSGKYETFSINGINVPEYEPVKSLDIQLTSVPIEYTIRDIVPNPNPIISTTMQGGEIHRYYRVVNNYNGNPLSLVPIEVISENYLQVFSSNEDGILDICIQSNKIGNGLPNSTKKFIVQKVNNEILELPIQFDTKVISRSYSRYFDGSRYLKLGGNLLGLNIDALKLEMGGISCLQVDEEFSQQPEKIQILRQGKATMEDLGFKVKSPGFKGKIGPVHAGAMAEAGGGISFTGLMEDEYIIQKGLSSIKGIGEKTAKIIIENGPYSCEELLVQRVPKRILNSRVLRILREEGCLEFDEDLFSKRVLRYNRKLFSDYEYLIKIDLSKKPKYTNRDYDRLKEDKVFK